jgi:hypothetical protein
LPCASASLLSHARLLVQDIQLKDLHRTRAALHEAQHECTRLRQQLELTQQCVDSCGLDVLD